jgi:hypothetical protein
VLLAGDRGVSGDVDAVVQAAEGGGVMLDRLRRHPGVGELPPCDHTLLSRGDPS